MAILNLVINARDAMTDGGKLTISLASETFLSGHQSKLAPGRYVRLSIADTGAGMDKETVARALEPFFSTKGIGKGTGLGLSIVDGLMSQCGGALALKSELGLGTAAELWLPMSAELSERVEPALATVDRSAAALGDGRSDGGFRHHAARQGVRRERADGHVHCNDEPKQNTSLSTQPLYFISGRSEFL
jgi:hypothetical protein